MKDNKWMIIGDALMQGGLLVAMIGCCCLDSEEHFIRVCVLTLCGFLVAFVGMIIRKFLG